MLPKRLKLIVKLGFITFKGKNLLLEESKDKVKLSSFLQKYPRILGPAVHLALRAPQPREAYIFAKSPFSKPPFLGS